MVHIERYYTFRELGKDTPERVVHKKIWVWLVYDLNCYGHHKARLVGYWHLTDIPVEIIYSGIFISILSAFLYSFLIPIKCKLRLQTLEMNTLRWIPLRKLSPYQGLIFSIGKATSLPLKNNYIVFSILSFDFMECLLLFLWKSKTDICMQQSGYTYLCIAVCVNDLSITNKYPKNFMNALENRFRWNLKGMGPISFHLGRNLSHTNTLVRWFIPIWLFLVQIKN